MGMLNPWFIIGVIAALSASWVAGWKMATDHHKAKALDALIAETKKANEIAGKTEQNLANLRIENRTIVKNAEKEVFYEKVYSDCRPTADGISLWNHAIEKPTGKPADSVPKPTEVAK
jgi:hypothetical protein